MRGGVYALGNFDGVHKGHQAVILAAQKKAEELGLNAYALTFEPHPRHFFQPNQPSFRLTPPDVKIRLLKALGIKEIIVLPFDETLASMPAKTFVEKILIDRFQARHIVAGHDFVFGHGRDGNMAKLSSFLKEKGIGTTEVDDLGDDGESFSSTRVRELLLEGNPEAAAEVLGRPWTLEGPVVKGAGIGGKGLGFPTLNLDLNGYLRPKFGVYTVRAGRAGEPLAYRGVANIGLRPTVDGKSENLEAYLFDFDETVYGETWCFALMRFLRPEKKFDSLADLKKQIEEDIIQAKKA
ncbi:MAG: bifunctional riboflavin kinase/FAD synthetase [Alphaproteobacteria bacterium]|nr:bifunctional riboflavin kinase/FAD synthetase [Alphaproteobacteria bacterium]